MEVKQNINSVDDKNMLLKYSSNFLNGQNYILGKREKKKVLSSFLSAEIMKKVFSYTSVIYLLLFWGFGFYLLYLTINLFFQLYILVGIVSFMLTYGIFYLGKYYFKRTKLNSLKDYFILEKPNLLNTSIILMLLVSIFPLFIGFFLYFVFSWIPLVMYIFGFVFLYFGIFIYIGINFGDKIDLKKLNVINFLLLPITFIYGLLVYSILYLFSKINNYSIVKETVGKKQYV